MLDRSRIYASLKPGHIPVDPTSSFEEGSMVILNSSGQWTKSTSGTAVGLRGIATVNKSSSINGVSIESYALTGVVVQNLDYANIVSNSQRVTSGGTVYVSGTDYTINYTQGTIVRIAAGSIVSGATVSIIYSYQLTTQQLLDKGNNITNNTDETLGASKLSVLMGTGIVPLTNFDTSQGYTPGTPVYDNGDGRITSSATGSPVKVGTVMSGPASMDPYLTIEYALL